MDEELLLADRLGVIRTARLSTLLKRTINWECAISYRSAVTLQGI
jgi:hypothetical protein